ncbi:exopolysaccharide biosynthesis polyprenyl glycosylphosphotransferase [Bacillus thuringiensis]|uniref:Exopolysaccharide biosynthesis polyprenyl glycosylphosphotransferase n=5 Tax=Bacillus thuringiensis TaxID=1428 RepID=A0A9X6ZQL6_BACTU|nr:MULTISPECIES: exopolysaccharide biosynthesis polyprenyl glycosylphosphotransferase [Bacillus]EAO55199.1 Undecaprenyl-phosphate galactosephosphotransferase [Bacillus thuringiensis serovar israelensis ATCC 35646]MED1157180.1 exopolysaccharide biosynthesis polyprenyl glycosylphosphotransferase [Bacillus paranthracis]AFQ17823.1 putative undecaprenyl-phosphate N-acetylgalactosaminyl-1-phosphate transferase [Bacillus thuringiensis HD-771]AFQ29111.1 putative undecaprenyl-phosphate N-acetylgalactosa
MKTGENIARDYQITPDTQTIQVESNQSKIYLGIKYLLDVMFSLVGLILLMPVILIFSILIILESPGSPFYLQERLGLNGKRFKVIKLRSMRNDAEKNGAKWAEKNDPRVTKIGLFIRKTRIDELPQLFNILKGDMSLVGPRPERPIFTEKFERDIPGFKKRLEVKPGLTGWAQVNGGYEITPKEKLNLDVYYINHASIILDFKIIIKTVRVVITGDGAR